MDQIPTTINGVIEFLRSGGWVALALAFLIERWPWFSGQRPEVKFTFAIVLAAAGGGLAYFLQGLTPEQATTAQQIWSLILYVFGWIGTITTAHIVDRALPKRFRPSLKAKD